jgi:hypothetical protein
MKVNGIEMTEREAAAYLVTTLERAGAVFRFKPDGCFALDLDPCSLITNWDEANEMSALVLGKMAEPIARYLNERQAGLGCIEGNAVSSRNLSGGRVNPTLLSSALFRFIDEQLEEHAAALRVNGCTDAAIAGGVERYRGQLAEQALRLVIQNGPDWWPALDPALEGMPTSGVAH